MNSSFHRKGFTLVEMLIVIAIIAVLASVALVSVSGVRKAARDTKRVSDISKMQQQLEVYYSKNGKYPAVADWTSDNFPEAAFTDPLGVAYGYQPSANDQKYVLRATMEGGTAAMNDANELDVPAASCDDDAPTLGYCVGN